MDAVSALVAGLISGLRAMLNTDVVVGGWAWAITALGVLVGLLPAAGALLVAIWRKGIGSRYGPGTAAGLTVIGVVSAGLLPWLAFTATGDVVRAAAAGRQVTGLRESDVAALAEPIPVPFADLVFDSQGDYLGGTTVRQAFDPADPAAFALAIGVLAVLPLIVAAFVWGQARIALRRGPTWPVHLFWLPALALPLLTAATPAGSSGCSWCCWPGGRRGSGCAGRWSPRRHAARPARRAAPTRSPGPLSAAPPSAAARWPRPAPRTSGPSGRSSPSGSPPGRRSRWSPRRGRVWARRPRSSRPARCSAAGAAAGRASG